MSDETARLHLSQLVSLQELNAVTWNEALAQLDALVDLYLLGQFVNTPPPGPQDGDCYLVGGAPTGAWSGQAYKIAAGLDGAWRFYAPFNGLRAYIAATGAFVVYLNGVWYDGHALISAGETAIASAATCDLGAANALFVQITGTAAITSFGTGANKLRFVRFAQGLTLTHNATSLNLLGGASRTTAAGDVGVYTSDGGGNWCERSYCRAAANPGDYATKSGTETLSAKSFSGPTYFADGTSSAPSLAFANNTSTGMYLIYGNQLCFGVGGAERLRINATSVLFSADATFYGSLTASGGCVLNYGGIVNAASNASDFQVKGQHDAVLLYTKGATDRVGIGTSGPLAKLDVAGDVFPHTANSCNLGSASYYWANGYIQNAWTVISDETLKAEIAPLTAAEQAVAMRIAPLIVSYKMKSAVAAKGSASARRHCGFIAQAIVAAFHAEGLDPFAYGCVGYDDAMKTVAATTTVSRPKQDESGRPLFDINGAPVLEDVEVTVENAVPDRDEDGVCKKIYNIRPDEVMALALAGLAARLADLEGR